MLVIVPAYRHVTAVHNIVPAYRHVTAVHNIVPAYRHVTAVHNIVPAYRHVTAVHNIPQLFFVGEECTYFYSRLCFTISNCVPGSNLSNP